MHWLDITILIVLGVGAAMGFYSGLLWQIARVVSLAISLYVAIITNTEAADWIGTQWKDVEPAVSRIIAFVGVFLLAYLILYLVTLMTHKAIEASQLKTLDRLLGAVLGTAKMGAVVACVCALMASLALPIFQEWFEGSSLAPHFANGTDVVVSWIPRSYRDRIDEGMTQVRSQLQKKVEDAAAETLRDAAKK